MNHLKFAGGASGEGALRHCSERLGLRGTARCDLYSLDQRGLDCMYVDTYIVIVIIIIIVSIAI